MENYKEEINNTYDSQYLNHIQNIHMMMKDICQKNVQMELYNENNYSKLYDFIRNNSSSDAKIYEDIIEIEREEKKMIEERDYTNDIVDEIIDDDE